MAVRKHKNYCKFFAIPAICLLLFTIWYTGIFNKDRILIKGNSCTCPDYDIIVGGYKLQSPLLDTAIHLDVSGIFVTGKPNPFPEKDYRAYNDYYLVEGTVTGFKKVSAGDPQNPLLEITYWKHIDELYLNSLLIAIVLFAVLACFSYIFYRASHV